MLIAGHIVMIVNGALDIRRRASIDNQIFSVNLATFFTNGLGQPITYTYDVRATYDTLADRFVILALQDNSAAEQKLLVMAVAKTANPEQGWNYLSANVLFPSASGRSRCFPDSPDVGYDANYLTFTANIFCVANGQSLGQSAGGYSDTFFYAFPKQGPASVYTSNVANAQNGTSYNIIAFEADLEEVAIGKLQPSSAAPVTIVVGIDGYNLIIYKFDNITATERSYSASRQVISLGDLFWSTIQEHAAQPSPYLLEAAQQARPCTMTYSGGSLYFAAEFPVNYTSDNSPQNIGIRWAAVNAATLVEDVTVGGYRRMTGAYLEATALVDAASTLGPDADIFYPAMTLDGAGNLGKLLV